MGYMIKIIDIKTSYKPLFSSFYNERGYFQFNKIPRNGYKALVAVRLSNKTKRVFTLRDLRNENGVYSLGGLTLTEKGYNTLLKMLTITNEIIERLNKGRNS